MLPPDVIERLGGVAADRGVPAARWDGVDDFLPLLEQMREEGAVVVLKLDGQRTGPDDAPPYTVVVSRGGLGDDYVSVEAHSAPEALARATLEYAERAWSAR